MRRLGHTSAQDIVIRGRKNSTIVLILWVNFIAILNLRDKNVLIVCWRHGWGSVGLGMAVEGHIEIGVKYTTSKEQ